MTDMLERGARGSAAAEGLWSLEKFDWSDPDHEMLKSLREKHVKIARGVLLAALDPEDEALVMLLAKHIRYATPGDEDFDISRARAALSALKAHCAQGETRT